MEGIAQSQLGAVAEQTSANIEKAQMEAEDANRRQTLLRRELVEATAWARMEAENSSSTKRATAFLPPLTSQKFLLLKIVSEPTGCDTGRAPP